MSYNHPSKSGKTAFRAALQMFSRTSTNTLLRKVSTGRPYLAKKGENEFSPSRYSHTNIPYFVLRILRFQCYASALLSVLFPASAPGVPAAGPSEVTASSAVPAAGFSEALSLSFKLTGVSLPPRIFSA